MTTITESRTRPWDFSHIIDFLPVASPTSPPYDGGVSVGGRQQDENEWPSAAAKPELSDTQDGRSDSIREAQSTQGLGDFAKVWQFLGAPPPTTTSKVDAIISKNDYTSDGAAYEPSQSRRVNIPQLLEGADSDDQAASLPASGTQSASEVRLNKKQRQKANKRARREEILRGKNTLSESECDSTLGRETPARKASSHAMTTRSVTAASLLQGETPDTPCPKTSAQWKVAAETMIQNMKKEYVARDVKLAQTKLACARAPIPPAPAPAPSKGALHTKPPEVSLQQKPITPSVYRTTNLIPSSVQPLPAPKQLSAEPMSAKKYGPPVIKPLTLRSGEDRNYALLMKIIHDFGEDRKYLVNPMNLTTHNNDPAGIHVFIDASNIFIGFVDQLKYSRNIHPLQQVPDTNLSFDSLALLLERRRPVAKRVLAGSTPRVAAFDKAEAVGYECSILEKVFKARELTERQVYFKELESRYGRRSSTKGPPPHKLPLANSVLSSGSASRSSGSETNTSPQFARPKLIEQGVDEILHLKLLESVVDAEVPSTIVLATGDAACAEYSSGFMAMVERALRKGWSVELVSWSRHISKQYRLPAWTNAWGSRFRIIHLDDYAEELLDM